MSETAQRLAYCRQIRFRQFALCQGFNIMQRLGFQQRDPWMTPQSLNPVLEYIQPRIAEIEAFRQHRDVSPKALNRCNGVERSPEYRCRSDGVLDLRQQIPDFGKRILGNVPDQRRDALAPRLSRGSRPPLPRLSHSERGARYQPDVFGRGIEPLVPQCFGQDQDQGAGDDLMAES